MAAKKGTTSTALAWLARQLSDGQEHRIDDLLIRGMMAGYSEQAMFHAAAALQVTRHNAQDEAPHRGAFVECWQLPTRQP